MECAGFTFFMARAVITPRMVSLMVAESGEGEEGGERGRERRALQLL